MSYIGLDVGTSSCKAIAFDEAGRELGRGAGEYAIEVPRVGWAEQDVEAVWRSALAALRQAIGQAVAVGEPPTALALSVQGEAIIPVDGQGRALRRAILGMDMRTVRENRWLEERFGAEALFQRTGMPLHTINTLPKLLWLQRNEPDLWRSAQQFLLYEDFLLRRLTGQAVISHCLASRTQMYDLAAGTWADDILEECGIERGRLAPLAPVSGGVVGELSRELTKELGLSGKVLVASGGHDQACAALGSGVTRPGLAMVSTGTAEVVEVAMALPQLHEKLRQGGISIYRHVVPGLYLAMTLNHSGGLALRWFRDTFCRWEKEQAAAGGQDAYDLILADAPQGPTDLLVLPHLAGSGTPLLDTTSKGAILGLTFATSRGAIAKAILEGLTYELRLNLDLLREAGISIRELHAVGGGARSSLWLQLKADICGVPLRVPRVTEAACLGAALLAGVAAGAYADPISAAGQVVDLSRRVEPIPGNQAAYAARYNMYRQLYPTLIGLHRQLG